MKKLFKRTVGFIALSIGALCLASCGGNNDEVDIHANQIGTGEEKIAVVKYMSHTSLNMIEDAIVQEVVDKLDETKYTLTKYDGAADSSIISQTMATLKQANTDVVICIATPVAIAAKTAFVGTNTKVVFAAVSDPVAADVVSNLSSPEGNVTGTCDAVDLEKQLELAYKVDPDLKNIGYIYTGGEANSVANFNRLEELAKEKGFTLYDRQVNSPAEITEVANALVSKIDALIVTDDNNVASAMSTLSTILIDAKVPCYCAADSEIMDGGMMGYSINYVQLGKDTADMAVDIISGKEVKDIPVKVYSSDELALYYNSIFVNNANISIPEELKAKAKDLAA
ncbi:MAG: ABC transporter substrate-binding protein [Acholeplasmatales bacterium]|nr:ABC transporter substrate-binding protein [Acholeplasmatales bacterium]MBQ4356648.1 ABC transporter substrate-binding protein [Acholeplasmatales bacterium]